jgi:hypothetical protein
MNTSAQSLVSVLVWFSIGFSLHPVFGQQAAGPFETARIQNPEDATVRALAQEPSFVFELTQSKEIEEFEFDLGTVKTSVEYVVELKASSKLAGTIHFSDISASCGCLSGFPKDIKLENTSTLPVRVAFRVPMDEEQFGKTILLVDRERDIQLRITLKGTAKHAVRLGKKVFAVDREGVSTFETELEFPFPDIEVDKLTFRPNSVSVVGFRIVRNETPRKLVFDVYSDSTDIAEILYFSVLQLKQPGVLCEIPVEIRRGYRNSARPSTVLLKEHETGRMGRVLIQYRGLTNPKERLERSLKGIAKNKHDHSEFEFVVHAILSGQSELLTVAELRVTDERLLANPNDFELSVEFQSTIADVPPFIVPIMFVSGVRR